ncbi:hypothetical protein ACKVMT_17190 [Halobacteriales archaeon Cl-PHB]
MSDESTCETHTWATAGVTSRAGDVQRIWECEDCPVWTAEPFDPDHERPWDDTWLADR